MGNVKMNNLFFGGNLTGDPETRVVGSSTVATFQIAYNESYQDGQTGEWKDKDPTFLKCEVWDQAQVPRVMGTLKTGSNVIVEGKLQIDRTEKDGVRFQYPKCRVYRFQHNRRENEGNAPITPPNAFPASGKSNSSTYEEQSPF